MEENERIFIDTDGNQYRTSAEPFAESGQGSVFLSNDKEIIVKTISDESLSYEAFVKQLDETSGIFINPNAEIARPIIKLERPEKGYVMRFLDEGEAINTLMKFKFYNLKDILQEYNESGGLKRRLLLLKDLAKTLWYIHQAGAVYGDISDKNVFISKMSSAGDLSTDNAKVRLLDAGNIRISRLDRPLYTPGYGAPEVLNGQPNTAESDLYSFALLAYTLLNITNYFDGVVTNNECWDAEPLYPKEGESAEGGGKAFIFDRLDNSNRVGDGILPWQFGMTEKLLGLFEQTFSYQSHKEFKNRPSAVQWYIALSEAAEEVCYCSNCDAHHYPGCIPHKGRYKGLYAIVDDLSPTDDGYRVINRRKVVCDNNTSIIDAKIRAATLDEITAVKLMPVTSSRFSVTAESGYTIELFERNGLIDKNIVSAKGTVLVTNMLCPGEYSMRITFTEVA